jgi:hypothetical protein
VRQDTTDVERCCSSSPSSRGFRVGNAELAFLLFGGVYCWLIVVSEFPFSTTVLRQVVRDSLELSLLVMLLALPIIAARAITHAWRCGGASLREPGVLRSLSLPYLTAAFFLRTLKRVVLTLGTIYLFVHLKNVILFWHHANFDRLFWNLDRQLHAGIQPNIWAMSLISPHQDLAVLIDWLYIRYFHYSLIAALIFLLEPRGRKLSEQFFLAYSLMWFLGGLWYIALPTDGPCYAVLSNYSIPQEHRYHFFKFPVTEDIPPEYVQEYSSAKIWYAKLFQEKLWVDRQAFLDGKQLPGVFYGIAAMPSLHVSAVALIMIFFFRTSILAGLIAALYTAVVFFGSIFLQWHYAVDGYAGLLLAVFVSLLSTRLPELWPEEAEAASATGQKES